MTHVDFIERQDELIAGISAEIDHHTVVGIREEIDRRMFYRRPRRLTLDLGSVGFMDSSGIALIIGRCEVARSMGATVRLVGLSAQLSKLIRLSGVERIDNLTVAPCER
ncbi:MAG: anti-sigma factor antagonist [Clostridia bacterium]|nr:anti-sigma factor antagonist [Clostridia bacterium]